SSGACGGAWQTIRHGTTPPRGHTDSSQIPSLLDNSLAWDVYVKLVTGVFVYVAFVTDAYARRILGWRVAATMATSMVLDAIEQAIWTRQREGMMDLKDVVHHTDRGPQGST